ncbi:MAG: hypothetical protein HYV07_33285 [Deltaproteobacteria bacterium]|nr:hypothetical protein [Deltaproteobacteria bacterium]
MTEVALRFEVPTYRTVREARGRYRHRPTVESAEDAYRILKPITALRKSSRS